MLAQKLHGYGSFRLNNYNTYLRHITQVLCLLVFLFFSKHSILYIYYLIFFGGDKTFYSPCPSMAGMIRSLLSSRAIETHRWLSSMRGALRHFMLAGPAQQATESRAKQEARLDIAFQ